MTALSALMIMDPRWAVPTRIQCGEAAAGQCPGAPTIPTTDGASARRAGGMSCPDIGARRATASEAACLSMCATMQMSDFSADCCDSGCCQVPETMATTMNVHFIACRLCEHYGTGQANSHGLSAATSTSHQRLPSLRFAFFSSVFLRALHAMSMHEHSLDVSAPYLR